MCLIGNVEKVRQWCRVAIGPRGLGDPERLKRLSRDDPR